MTLLVEGGGGLVEDENFWVFDQGPGYGDTLLLAARKLRAFESAKLFEARMEILFILFDLFHINHLLESLFIHLFHPMPAVHPDVPLEILPGMRIIRQIVHLVVLL